AWVVKAALRLVDRNCRRAYLAIHRAAVVHPRWRIVDEEKYCLSNGRAQYVRIENGQSLALVL
ncbi:MAG TPA: hypothetical protein VM682_05330, partial [Bacillus sp. (in: firmicutes)]|nr:hypothetical protein [Bacillus sp. (in: firmicutes)]